jgi:phage terminase large subunit
MGFEFTPKQAEAQNFLSSIAMYVMLFGGSRSGKTFLHVRNVIMRALKAPSSRHLIARFRFNHLKASIILDTFPKVMALCFPKVKYELSKTDWFVSFANGAEIWFVGLDDRDRTEKVLGLEFATIFLNECSQISWQSVQTILTRLAAARDAEGRRKDANAAQAARVLRLQSAFEGPLDVPAIQAKGGPRDQGAARKA